MAKRKPTPAYRTNTRKIERGRRLLLAYYESVKHIKGNLVATENGVVLVPVTDHKPAED